MAEGKQKIHCLHICGHLDALLQEKANKQSEERKQAEKPPIQCMTSEDSCQLHEIYKDRVLRTKPCEEKKKSMEDLMQSVETAKLAHSLMLLNAKQEEIGIKRHPSTLSHMHHDDSDSEGEVEDDGAMDGTASVTQTIRATNAPAMDGVQDNTSDTNEADLTNAIKIPILVVTAESSTETEHWKS